MFPSLSLYNLRGKSDDQRPPNNETNTNIFPVTLQSPLNLYLLRRSLFDIISLLLSSSSEPRTVLTSLSSHNHRCLSSILSHVLSYPAVPPPSDSSDPSDHIIYEANAAVHTSCLNLLVHVIPIDPPSYGPLVPLIVQVRICFKKRGG